MIVIVTIIVVTGIILLINVLMRSSGRDTPPEELQGKDYLPRQDELRRWADKSPASSAEEEARLTQRLEADPRPTETATSFPTKEGDRSYCPACGAFITAHDESCPSCEIVFVSDGSRTWTPGTVGPAEGIYRPPTEVSD